MQALCCMISACTTHVWPLVKVEFQSPLAHAWCGARATMPRRGEMGFESSSHRLVASGECLAEINGYTACTFHAEHANDGPF